MTGVTDVTFDVQEEPNPFSNVKFDDENIQAYFEVSQSYEKSQLTLGSFIKMAVQKLL